MAKKFNFIDLDKSKLPVTKGKKVDGYVFKSVPKKAKKSVTIHGHFLLQIAKSAHNFFTFKRYGLHYRQKIFFS